MNNDLVSTEVERSDGTLIVHLSGEIDLSNGPELQQQLEGALLGSPRAVIDLTEMATSTARASGMAQIGDYVEILDTVDG